MNIRLFSSMCRYFLSILAVILLGIIFFLWWGIGGSLPDHAYLSVEGISSADKEAPDNLVLASYNIGHGQGLKEEAWDWRDKDTTERQLNLIVEAMIAMDADIYFLQEVDLDSNRTFHINQIEFIKARTKHAFHACALVWEKNYLPFPYWPPTHHLGYIRSANCILSRFPLSNHERIIFPKPKSNAFWYNLGYIDRALQRVDVKIGDQSIALINLHLEAWDKESREEQITKTIDFINNINLPIILGGDFNTVMPKALKKHGFTDDKDANYEGEQTMEILLSKIKGLKAAPIDENISATFPSINPNRRLDYIFLIGDDLSFIDFRIAHEASIASDHLPVVSSIKYR